jgi:hypothetical protein
MVNMHDLFNKKLAEFIDDLIYIYPTIDDFKVFRTTSFAASILDIKGPQVYFQLYVVEPYETKIMARDEQFFMRQTYDDDTNQNLDIVAKLKNVWGTMLAQNKEIIWKYLQVLVYLSKQCTRGGANANANANATTNANAVKRR